MCGVRCVRRVWLVLVEPREWTLEQIAEFVGDDPAKLNPMLDAG